MTEEDARAWIEHEHGVPRGTLLSRYAELLVAANAAQNLVAPSTVAQIWSRHMLDSAQLMNHAPPGGTWLDIGSGAGFPGLVAACLRDDMVELVEPRRLRTDFLKNVVDDLGLRNVTVTTAKVQRTSGVASVITARAVAGLDEIFTMAVHRADLSTTWILPKGRNAELEVEVARFAWQGSFHVEHSMTADDSYIVIARGVRRK